LSKKEQAPPHELVPEHKLLSADEKKKVLQKFRVADDCLPRIHLSDPAIIGLSAKIGDLVQIKRKEASGESDHYRVVVKA